MVFIDYNTLMLVNMGAGFVTVALFLVWGLKSADARGWAAPFAVVGLIALLTGLHMTTSWPLPGLYNILFGELTLLMAAAFLGLALGAGMNWSLAPMGAYILFSGLASLWLGYQVIQNGLTAQPAVSGIGFILSGGGAVLAAIALYLRSNRLLNAAAALALTLAALVWLATAFMAYGMHVQKDGSFSHWKPSALQMVEQPKK